MSFRKSRKSAPAVANFSSKSSKVWPRSPNFWGVCFWIWRYRESVLCTLSQTRKYDEIFDVRKYLFFVKVYKSLTDVDEFYILVPNFDPLWSFTWFIVAWSFFIHFNAFLWFRKLLWIPTVPFFIVSVVIEKVSFAFCFLNFRVIRQEKWGRGSTTFVYTHYDEIRDVVIWSWFL